MELKSPYVAFLGGMFEFYYTVNSRSVKTSIRIITEDDVLKCLKMKKGPVQVGYTPEHGVLWVGDLSEDRTTIENAVRVK